MLSQGKYHIEAYLGGYPKSLQHAGSVTKGYKGFKLKEGRFKLDVMNKFFLVRVMRLWNTFLREAVDVPSLEVFKAMLDKALGSLV